MLCAPRIAQPLHPAPPPDKSLINHDSDVIMGPDRGAHDHKRKSALALTCHHAKRPSTLIDPAAAQNKSMQGGPSLARLQARSEPSEAQAKGGPKGPDERADAVFGAWAP